MDLLEKSKNREIDQALLNNRSHIDTLNDSKINTSDYYRKLIHTIELLDLSATDFAISLIRNAWQAGKQIICFGNGGSALTAQHFINDWNKSIYLSSGKPFRGRCLTENMGLITAYANDMSYQDIFVEQLKNIIDPGDIVIGISGSGNSENVLRAVQFANSLGNITIGLCGFDGGKLREIAQHPIWVPIKDMQVSEDIHFIFGHIVMQSLCQS